MRSVKSSLRTAPSRFVRALVCIAVFGLSLSGCADGFTPLTDAPAPQELLATALRPGVVQLRWQPVVASSGGIASYIVERRVATTGPFVEVARVPATSGALELLWIDSDVAPETIYGYRVLALTNLGNRSLPSVVGGVVTAPPPGIEIVTLSTSTTSAALDPDGYQVTIMGPDTVRATLNGSARRRFSPLRTGRYTVALSGLISRCSAAQASKEVVVSDTSAQTIAAVDFNVTCKDPNRGEFTVATAVTGDSLDQTWIIDVLGQAADTALPPAERVFSRTVSQTIGAPITTLENVRPGTYNIKIQGIAGNCTVSGAVERSITVAKLGRDTVRFAVACVGAARPTPPVSTAPFIWRSTWNPRTAAVGASVELQQTLDLTARATQRVAVVQARLRYDATVLRYEEETAGQLAQFTINASVPGEIQFIAGQTGLGRLGVVNLGKFRFTVIGATGTKSPVRTIVTVASAASIPFVDSVRVVEDTFTVGTGGGTTANQPPVAQVTGPTTGVVGTALAFSGSGSTDSDGTIASYAWTFGDNTTGTGASVSKTYTAAGTYSVSLLVTDNRGATATKQATITISPGTQPPPPPPSPPNAPPVAEANGPYTAQVGVPVTLSSASSTNAASFSWALGNGQTATGASPSVTYSAAGTFTVVLTVTSSSGATSTDQATVTVTAAPPPPPPPPSDGSTPLTWKNFVQAYNIQDSTIAVQIAYDISANLTETPGPEALHSFVLDSLKWDPTVMQFVSISLGNGITGTVNEASVATGRLAIRGTTTPGLDRGNLVIATIRYRVIGVAGRATTTATFLGALTGTAATNSYAYRPRTAIVEGRITAP